MTYTEAETRTEIHGLVHGINPDTEKLKVMLSELADAYFGIDVATRGMPEDDVDEVDFLLRDELIHSSGNIFWTRTAGDRCARFRNGEWAVGTNMTVLRWRPCGPLPETESKVVIARDATGKTTYTPEQTDDNPHD